MAFIFDRNFSMINALISIIACLLIPLWANAHDIVVKGTQGNIDVLHFHQCTPQEIASGDPDVSIKIHRKAFNKDKKNLLIAQANALVSVINGKAPTPVVKRTSPPNNGINCHGWAFDAGKSWIDDPIDLIENRCTLLKDQTKPPVGATVIYLDHMNRVTHSGKVVRKGEKGEIWIKSQWGKLGDFEHLPTAVPNGQRHSFKGPKRKKHTAQEANYGTATYWQCQ